MNIEARKSIHREDEKTKLDDSNTAKNQRDSRKIRLDDKNNQIRGERNFIGDGTALIHGSQEHLYEEIEFESEKSHSATSKNQSANNNVQGLKSSSILRRNTQHVSHIRTESPNRPQNLKPNLAKKSEQVSGNRSLSTLLAVALVFGLLFLFYQFILIGNSRQKQRHCSLKELMNKYPDESLELWTYLKSDIEDILIERINKPSVTLFIHNGGTRPNKLIRDIANTASNCIDSSLKPIEFMSSDFTSDDAANDYGVIIDKYRKTGKEGNVVMIANLNEIPAEAARALHAICDRETPIFRKVVILLSLRADNNGERPIDIAENALSHLWEGKLLEHELGPLKARVTDEVILLRTN